MSSWYVWAALGIYPVTPGTSILAVTTPLFDPAEIKLPAGKSITINAPGASNGLKYINSMMIDGQHTDQTFLPESIIYTSGVVWCRLCPTGTVGSLSPEQRVAFFCDDGVSRARLEPEGVPVQ